MLFFFAGLQVKRHYGLFLKSGAHELVFGNLSADASFSAELEHTGRLSPREYAYLQCAVLYTSVEGQRRVRVVNLAMNVVELAGNLFQFADLETVVCHMAKEGAMFATDVSILLLRTLVKSNVIDGVEPESAYPR